MKAYYKKKPECNAVLLKNGDVAVCINWQPKDVKRTLESGKTRTEHGYECERLDVPLRMLTSDTVIEHFVRSKYSASDELALVNSYNASISGLDKNEAKEQEYKEFLQWRASMKQQVKAAIETFTWPTFDEAAVPRMGMEEEGHE